MRLVSFPFGMDKLIAKHAGLGRCQAGPHPPLPNAPNSTRTDPKKARRVVTLKIAKERPRYLDLDVGRR